MPDPIIMWAVVSTDPYWGYYGGYHDMLYAIKDELIKIGIDLRIKMFEPGVWWDIIWEDQWNKPGDVDGHPETYTYGTDGWDFFCGEWWQHHISYIWLDELTRYIYPESWDIMPHEDEEADYLFEEAMTAIDPETRQPDDEKHKTYLGLWQERFMYNPPVITVYYADIMSAHASYMEGHDAASWFYDLTKVRINKTTFDAVAPAARKAVGSDTLFWGAVEPIWTWNPVYTLYYTEEEMNVLTKGMLWAFSREDLEFPTSGPWIVKPIIAKGFPEWYWCSELGYEYEEDYPVARVELQPNIYWTDGVPFNASDVKFTFETIINGDVGGYAYGDYWYLIKEVVANDTLIADFIMYELDYDFAGYNAHGWGLGMLPWHQLKDVDPSKLRLHETYDDPFPVSFGGKGLECLGPYVPTKYTPGVAVECTRVDVAIAKAIADGKYTPYPGYSNPYPSWDDYYWYANEELRNLGWGRGGPPDYDQYWELPKYFITKIIPEAEPRLIALQTLEVDSAEYPTAPVETYEDMMDWPTHRVFEYAYPSSNPLWMNLDNPILSNRYVRLAIAHAIPYEKIFTEILGGWGISKAYPGKTFITPWQIGWNEELKAWSEEGTPEERMVKAQAYMDMWRKSQIGTTYTEGPVGDGDFSGFVDGDDYLIWLRDKGEKVTDLEFKPGNDIDPDYDNTVGNGVPPGYIDLDDFFIWRDEGFLMYYPECSTTWQWSRQW